MTNKLFNFSGYLLTPPAFFLNLWEWLANLNSNQVFTFIISLFVIVFWYYKIKEQKAKAQKVERELNSQ